MKVPCSLVRTCFRQAHLKADEGGACARSLARLVREAPLAADLAPYYEHYIGALIAAMASLPAGCAGPVNETVSSCTRTAQTAGMQRPATSLRS